MDDVCSCMLVLMQVIVTSDNPRTEAPEVQLLLMP